MNYCYIFKLKRLSHEKIYPLKKHHILKVHPRWLRHCGINSYLHHGTYYNTNAKHVLLLYIFIPDIFRTQMPSVTYSRLDGSVPAGSRHNIVQR